MTITSVYLRRFAKIKKHIRWERIVMVASVGLILVTALMLTFKPIEEPDDDIFGDIFSNPALLLEARLQGIEVSEEELEGFIEGNLAEQNISREHFNVIITAQNLTIESYKAHLKNRLIIYRLITTNIDLFSMNVPDDDLDAYIDKNRADLVIVLRDPGGRENVREILLRQRQQQAIEDYVKTVESINW